MFEIKDMVYFCVIFVLLMYAGVITICAISNERRAEHYRNELDTAIEQHKKQLGRIGESIDSASFGLERSIATMERMEQDIAKLASGATSFEQRIINITARLNASKDLVRGINEAIGKLTAIVAELYSQSQ